MFSQVILRRNRSRSENPTHFQLKLGKVYQIYLMHQDITMQYQIGK